ncbi:MAG: hypothetical protein WKF95_10900 [Rubrobacter sp.]
MPELTASIPRNVLCPTDRPRLSNEDGREIRRAPDDLKARKRVEVVEIGARRR